MTSCRGSWVVGGSRGLWVWVWVKVLGNSRGYQKKEKKEKTISKIKKKKTIIHNQLSAICDLHFCVAISTFSYFFLYLFVCESRTLVTWSSTYGALVVSWFE